MKGARIMIDGNSFGVVAALRAALHDHGVDVAALRGGPATPRQESAQRALDESRWTRWKQDEAIKAHNLVVEAKRREKLARRTRA